MTPEETLYRASWFWLRDRVVELEREVAAMRTEHAMDIKSYNDKSFELLAAERDIAASDAKIIELTIERDKEVWRTYADHTHKELLRSNGALTAKLIELGREVSARDQRIRAIDGERRALLLDPENGELNRLRLFLKDTVEDMECLPECDSYGHAELCPVTNTVQAFRLLRERLATLESDNAEQQKMLEEYAAGGANEILDAVGLSAALTDAQAENSVLREQIAEAWSAHGEVQKRVTEREELFRDACRTITDMETRDPDKRIAELEAAMADLNSYDAPAEVVTLRQQLAERDERILELEYQCKFNEGYFATLKELGLPERFLEEYQSQKMQIRELEQQLKSTQERLAEAEQLLRDVLETTPVDEHGYQWGMRGLKEYFAKHAPAIDPTAEIDPPEFESDEPEVKE